MIVGTRADNTAPRNLPPEAKRDARCDERETKEEAREVAARGCAEVLLCFVKFSDEKRPCGACAVDLIEERRPGTEHRRSVARTWSQNEGGPDRPLSEFVPSSPSESPTVVGLNGAPIGRRFAMRGEDAVARSALLVLMGSLIAGCAPDGPLGAVGAIVTAPITAPVMFVSARMNDREDHLERARRNDRPPPPIDAQSREMARATLEQALERGTIDEGFTGRTTTARAAMRRAGSPCSRTGRRTRTALPEVLIETAMERRPTDQRVRTYCRDGAKWRIATGCPEVRCRASFSRRSRRRCSTGATPRGVPPIRSVCPFTCGAARARNARGR